MLRKPAPKRGPGRPAATGTTRTEPILIRVTPDERKRLQRAADRAGVTLVEWMRDVALQATRPRAGEEER